MQDFLDRRLLRLLRSTRIDDQPLPERRVWGQLDLGHLGDELLEAPEPRVLILVFCGDELSLLEKDLPQFYVVRFCGNIGCLLG